MEAGKEGEREREESLYGRTDTLSEYLWAKNKWIEFVKRQKKELFNTV